MFSLIHVGIATIFATGARTWIQEYRDTGLHEYRDTFKHGYRDTRIQVTQGRIQFTVKNRNTGVHHYTGI